MVVVVTNTKLLFLLKLIRKISFDNFLHWNSTSSLEIAFEKIMKHREGLFYTLYQDRPGEFPEETLTIPSSQSEMIKLIQKQHNELQEIKNEKAVIKSDERRIFYNLLESEMIKKGVKSNISMKLNLFFFFSSQ